MTEATTTISVRGDARHVVPADFAIISTSIHVRDPDKDATIDRAGRAQTATVDALREHGGTALSIETLDAPLTWSTRSFSAERDEEWDGGKRPLFVGWQVRVPVTVTLRDLTRLADVAAVLTSIADLALHHVSWEVDPRNPAWPVVRAAAIHDAIVKARDYATALNGSVTALVHVADAGLLGGQDRFEAQSMARVASGAIGDFDGRGPVLDPAPQEISAVIEARFEATVGPL
jgi:uncharacterized protein YggE